MTRDHLLAASARWFALLLHLYPPDFRDEVGRAVFEAYLDRARIVIGQRGGWCRLAILWIRAFGDALASGVLERLRPSAAWRRSGNWGRDAEMAIRRLRQAPVFVVAVLTTLTLGLGAFAIAVTLVQKILLEPLPYRDPEDLYVAFRDYRAVFDLNRGWLGGTDVAELQKAGGVITEAAGLQRMFATFSSDSSRDPIQIGVMAATPNLFDLLGVAPALGRGFASDEVGPGRPAVLVLTDELWDRLGANPAVVGTTVRLNGQPYTVIGVMPKSFAFVRNASLGTFQRADAYTTFDVNLAETNPGNGSYSGLIRARRGTSPALVTEAVEAVGELIDRRDFGDRGIKLYPVGLQSDLVSGVRPALVAVGLTGVVLVLVLLANLAALLLTRAATREHEFAVSRALGANGVAVVRAMLIEGVLLGVAGSTGALVVATWGVAGLVQLAPADVPRLEGVTIDWRVVTVVIGTGALLGLLAAAVPASWAARANLSALLAASAVRGGGGHGRMRRGMVVVQVALSLVLLNAGVLVAQSLNGLLRADPGFRAAGVLTLRVPMPAALVTSAETAVDLQDRIQNALAALPGVEIASAGDVLPLTAGANQTTITIPGAPGLTGDADRDSPLVDYIGVRAGYAEALGLRLAEGRPFGPFRREGVREAMIDTQLARQFFPTRSALGATIPFRDQAVTVVGVVEQPRLYDVHQDGRPQLFLRAEDWDYRNLSYVMRTRRDPRALAADAQAAVRRIAPYLAVASVRTMDEIVGDALRQQRLSTVLIAGVALGAVMLAAMGVFGVVSASVARRRHDLAVQQALGASPRRVLHLVLADGARLIVAGIVIGIPGIFVVARFLRGVLVGVSPTEPLTLAGTALGLVIVSLAASYVPARRTLLIEPAELLRR
jgi:predicted permease